MNPAYARLRATAERLIGRWGKAGVLTREERSGPPHAPVITPVEYPVKLVTTNYSMTNRNETLIEAGDKVGLVSTEAGVIPELDDLLEIDGHSYRLVDVQPLNPGGLTLLTEFVGRR